MVRLEGRVDWTYAPVTLPGVSWGSEDGCCCGVKLSRSEDVI
jgi:hypothetical protein